MDVSDHLNNKTRTNFSEIAGILSQKEADEIEDGIEQVKRMTVIFA